MDISRLDLNLVLALDALLAERNVTRAARRLNLSQPALSARLNRLRAIFGDPLLLPAQRGMVPTQRALELQEPLHSALEGLRQVLAEGAPFDASTATATIAISGSDYVQHAVLGPLVLALREEAPGIRIAWRGLDLERLDAQMERGEVDLALLTPQSASGSLRMIKLYREHYAVVARKDHPRVHGCLDLELFCDLEHIVVSVRGGGFRGATDLILDAVGKSRRVVLSAPGFLVVPQMVARSDMLAVVPFRLARDYAGTLQVLEPPLTIPGFDIAMVWHDRTTTHPIQRWLRERIVGVARSGPRSPGGEPQPR
ncbi:MAG TPA: LysR family transcriptional regulator [Caulobacteraceae bacterium]|nr:LysR family transcriptional regulator [Caulobacteraceae bacterium]